MKPALILMDHGSRRAESNEALEAIAVLVREADPDRLVEIAHMEIERPNLMDAVAACAEAGASEVVLVPYFLGPGRHTQRDIPRLARAAAARHPELTLRVAAPLGPDRILAELALRRAQEP